MKPATIRFYRNNSDVDLIADLRTDGTVQALEWIGDPAIARMVMKEMTPDPFAPWARWLRQLTEGARSAGIGWDFVDQEQERAA